MAAIGQNFTGYIGDDLAPVFTVTDSKNVPIDISAAVQITWLLIRNGAAILTKLKTTAGVAFVNTGADGQFKVILSSSDTIALSGTYTHTAKVTDGTGKTTTVTIGSCSFGFAPTFTYDATALTGTTAYAQAMQIRTLIGDVNAKDAQLWDEQIYFALAQRPNIYAAGADCCRQIAAKYSRDVDITEGLLHKSYSARARAYAARAMELDQRAKITGRGLPYAGGISQTDKQNAVNDGDRVQPQFMIGLTDSWLPVSPVDNQNDSPTFGPIF